MFDSIVILNDTYSDRNSTNQISQMLYANVCIVYFADCVQNWQVAKLFTWNARSMQIW